ncbi:unnamed protein product [Adineta steineri]|uniref:Uncharacterized protein n=1 Tax=Adineta steineri TaxID=433720 RepID=A0A814WIZ1_9BILA|nr:unnamed protein product [Adineta steineri]CAF3857176.1 unnamed protein product [Adineta steineri]
MYIDTEECPIYIQTIQSERGHNNVDRFKSKLIEQKEEYEQQITQLTRSHNEQVSKLCHEVEESASVLHKYKIELDSMRVKLQGQEKQIAENTNNELCPNRNLQIKCIKLKSENRKLKKDLSKLSIKYDKLINEMEDARQYVLEMITNLD